MEELRNGRAVMFIIPYRQYMCVCQFQNLEMPGKVYTNILIVVICEGYNDRSLFLLAYSITVNFPPVSLYSEI